MNNTTTEEKKIEPKTNNNLIHYSNCIKIYAVKLRYNKFIHFFNNQNEAVYYIKNVDDESTFIFFENTKDIGDFIKDNKQDYLFNFSRLNNDLQKEVTASVF